jgi:glycosyltransferase involved in cell wall biosynthesis
MKTAITYIVATYNSARTITRCLEGFSKLNDDRITVIVIDGGSKDGTIEIVQQYSDLVSEFITEPDSGIYDAFNKGLALASTPWVGFVGSDDFLTSDSSGLFDYIIGKEADYDFATGSVMLIDAEGKSIKPVGEGWTWARCRKRMLVAHVGALFNTRLFSINGRFNTSYRVCGDYDFLLRIGRTARAHYTCSTIANMEVGGASDSMYSIYEAVKVKWANKSCSIGSIFFIFAFDILSICKRKIIRSRG